MARRDVELVVRARDEAKKVVNSLTGAIDKFTKAQDGLLKQSGETDSTLSRLGSTFGELDKQLRGFTVGDQIKNQLRRASEASERLDKSLKETGAESKRVSLELRKVTQENEKLAASATKAKTALSGQQSITKKAEQSQKRLTTSLRQANAEREKLARSQAADLNKIAAQNARVEEATRKYEGLAAQIRATEAPTKRLSTSFESANNALAKQKARLLELQSAYNGNTAALAKAEVTVKKFGKNLADSNNNLTQQTSKLSKLQQEYTETSGAAQAAGRRLKSLREDSEKLEQSLLGQKTALERTGTEMKQLAAAAGQADTVLRSLADKSGAELQKNFDRQRRTLLETKREWKEYQAAVKEAALGTAKIGPPTLQVAQALERARLAAAKGKAEYLAQRDGLNQLSAVLRRTGGDVDTLRAKQSAFVAVQARTGAAIARIRTQSEQAARSNTVLAASSERAARGLDRVSGSANRVGSATNRAAVGTSRLSGVFNRLNDDTRRSLSTTQRLRGQVLSLVAAYGGFYGVISLIGRTRSAVRDLEAATSRLNVVFDGDNALVGKELDFIRRNSERLGLEFGSLAQEYTKFAVATKGTNLEGAKTRKIFLGIAESARVNKLTTEQTKRAFTALTQIASKGVVQMEELRQQLGDSIPGAIQKFAKSVGYGTDELGAFFKAVTDGEISSDSLVNFAKVLQDEAGPQLEKALDQNTAKIDKFFNSITFALQRFGASGIDDALADLAGRVGEVFASAQFESFAQRVSAAFAILFDIVGSVAENFDILVIAASAFAGVKLSGLIIGLVAAFGRLRTTMVATAVASRATGAALGSTATGAGVAAAGVGRLRLAIQLLTSSTGIGLLITGLSIAFGAWATSTNDVTEALNENRTAIDAAKSAYEEAEGSVEKFRQTFNKLSATQVDGAIRKTREAVADLKDDLDSLVVDSAKESASFAAGRALLNPFFEAEKGARAFFDELDTLEEKFSAGQISAKDFKDELVRIGQASNIDAIDDYALSLEASADKAIKLEGQLKELEQVQAGLTGTNEEAKAALDDLTSSTLDAEAATDKVAQAMKGEGAQAAKAFTADLDALESKAKKATTSLKDLNQVKLDQLKGQLALVDPGLAQAAGLPQRIQALQASISSQGSGRGSGARGYANTTPPNSSSSSYLNFAASMLGMNETDQRTAVQRYLQDGGAGLDPKVTAWCAAFVNASLQKGGFKGTGSNLARSFENYGQDVTDSPQIGDIAVFSRGDPNGPYGHVGFYQGEDGDGNVRVLGGNQGGRRNGGGGVSVQSYSKKRLLSIRRPGGQDAGTVAETKRRDTEAAREEKRHAKELQRIADKRKANEEATAAGIEQKKFELSIADEGIVKQKIATELRNAELAAKAAGRELTAEERTQIEEVTRALAEKEVAQRAAKTAAREGTDEAKAAAEQEKKVNLLLEQRKQLLEQLKIFQDAGNQEGVDNTKTKLETLNEQLILNATKAREMWAAIGGDAADTAISKLDTTVIKAQNVGASAQQVKSQWAGVDDLFASGLTNAFDSFAKAVANGEDVFEAAKTAFLQFAADFLRQIAQMIIKQAILNALGAGGGSGGGGGGGVLSSLFGGLFGSGHTGGIVGSSRVGSANQSRSVSPAVFAGAQRFHSGGLPGLRTNEVATILKKGEEVLNEGDPRNVLNGGSKSANMGGGGGGGASPNVKIVNAIDSGSFIDAGLNTKGGEKALLNFMRVNSNAVSAALSG